MKSGLVSVTSALDHFQGKAMLFERKVSISDCQRAAGRERAVSVMQTSPPTVKEWKAGVVCMVSPS